MRREPRPSSTRSKRAMLAARASRAIRPRRVRRVLKQASRPVRPQPLNITSACSVGSPTLHAGVAVTYIESRSGLDRQIVVTSLEFDRQHAGLVMPPARRPVESGGVEFGYITHFVDDA